MTNLFAHNIKTVFLIFFIGFVTTAFAQVKKDTMSKEVPLSQLMAAPDSAKNKKADSARLTHSPRKAIIRSAIIPGWGQIYNKKYWKLPIVYGALGATAYVFFDNIKTYKDLRFAYLVKYNMRVNHTDSAEFAKINPLYQPISEESLRANRDQFRRYIDYSVLVFALLWGINVVDAAVDAHLKTFDVSPDLTLQLRAGYSEMAHTNGVSLILSFK